MREVAKGLNNFTGGKLSPNAVTIFGLLMHIPIALLIAKGYFGYGAVLLVIFGLFDTLDGELARLQKRASAAGMLLDASTDRMKEVLLYTGVAYALASSGRVHAIAWVVAACGFSICVSYVKAKGEMAMKDSDLSANEINRLFADGLMRFEVRMFLLVVGLATDRLLPVIIFIAVLSVYTALTRLVRISRKLT